MDAQSNRQRNILKQSQFSELELQNSLTNLNTLIEKINQSLNQPDSQDITISIQNLKTQNDEDELKFKNPQNNSKCHKALHKLHRKNKLSTVMQQSVTQEDPNSARYNVADLASSLISNIYTSNLYASQNLQYSQQRQGLLNFTANNKPQDDKQPLVAPYKKIRGIRKFTGHQNCCSDRKQSVSILDNDKDKDRTLLDSIRSKVNEDEQLKSQSSKKNRGKAIKCWSRQQLQNLHRQKSRKGLTLVSCSKNIRSQQSAQVDKFSSQRKHATQINSIQKQLRQVVGEQKRMQINKRKRIDPFSVKQMGRDKENNQNKKMDGKSGNCLTRLNPRDFYNRKRINK